jgi:hypothetical protein
MFIRDRKVIRRPIGPSKKGSWFVSGEHKNAMATLGSFM